MEYKERLFDQDEIKKLPQKLLLEPAEGEQ